MMGHRISKDKKSVLVVHQRERERERGRQSSRGKLRRRDESRRASS